MSFAKKMARKIKKQANKGDRRAVREYNQARQSVKDSYVNQLKRDRECRKETIHNLTACFLLAMHEGHGFGSGRLMKLRDKMKSVFDAIVGGYVSVEEVAEYLEKDIGLNIGIAAENPNAGHYRQIEFQAVKEMSSAFLMAMLDEFGWKKKRLAKAYDSVAFLSEEVAAGHITYPEICSKVDAVFSKAAYPPKGRFKAVTHVENKASA